MAGPDNTVNDANVFDVDGRFFGREYIFQFQGCRRPAHKFANDYVIIVQKNGNTVLAADFRTLRQNQQGAVAIKGRKFVRIYIQRIQIVMTVRKTDILPFVFLKIGINCFFAGQQSGTFNIGNGVRGFFFITLIGQGKKLVKADIADFNDFVQTVKRRPSFSLLSSIGKI